MQTVSGYFGVQGGGKSYEIVKNVIVPALARTDRRVVANIDGLNADALSDFLGKDVRDRVILYADDDLIKPGFIPTAAEVDAASSEATVQPGDLLIIDEGARNLGKTKRPPEHVLDFFRMARHYTDPDTGVPSNIVIAAQSINMIHNDVRCQFATVTKVRKLIVVGKPNRYVMHVYDGDKMSRDALANVLQCSYEPEIFPLYKSHAGGAGNEVMVDDRVNVFKSRSAVWLKRIVIGIVVMIVVLSWWLWSQWRAVQDAGKPVHKPAAAAHASPSASAVALGGRPVPPKPDAPRLVLGTVVGPAGRFALLDTPDGVAYASLDGATVTPMGVFLTYEGVRYTSLAAVRRSSGGSTGLFPSK